MSSKQCRPRSDAVMRRLIWVYTVCSGLSVLCRVSMVIFDEIETPQDSSWIRPCNRTFLVLFYSMTTKTTISIVYMLVDADCAQFCLFRSTHLLRWRIAAFCLITKTCLYNFDPLKPHFYIVKLGFTEVYIIFLISAQNYRLWVLVRTASPRRF